jgi:hypothetical protein
LRRASRCRYPLEVATYEVDPADRADRGIERVGGIRQAPLPDRTVGIVYEHQLSDILSDSQHRSHPAKHYALLLNGVLQRPGQGRNLESLGVRGVVRFLGEVGVAAADPGIEIALPQQPSFE